MFRNYLAAALRNLARNRLYAGINIIGLAVGFAAAILMALFVRDELSYDKWLPNAERTYLLTFNQTLPGRDTMYVDQTPAETANLLKLDFPSIHAIARISGAGASIRKGNIENNEQIYWADPNFFDVIRLPVVAGDIQVALQQPDGIVLTREMARKYFGRDDPVGEALEIDRQHPMKVVAVIEDLPSNTHLNLKIVASGSASFSSLTRLDSRPVTDDSWQVNAYTYLRLASDASAGSLREALPTFMARHKGPFLQSTATAKLNLVPISAVHLSKGTTQWIAKPRGDLETIYAIVAVGILIVLVASINFVNLMTARAARRAVEVGIRKVSGAARQDLIVQFIGESMLYAGLGMVLAVAIGELLLPSFNAFLDRTIVFDYWGDLSFFGGIISATLTVGTLAGFYPAFVLSAFMPAAVLKGGVVQASGAGEVRQALVVLQFAIMIGLILATGIIYRQTQFALTEGMHLDRDQVVLIFTDCKNALKDEVQKLPGVQGIACSSGQAIDFGVTNGPATTADGTQITMARNPIDFGFFELYGLKPVAGRFFSREHGGDAVPHDPQALMQVPVVINEAAVRKLGFQSSDVAIGMTTNLKTIRGIQTSASEIIGVVPDFALDSVHDTIAPAIYFLDPDQSQFLSAKLNGHDLPETLKAIDGLWAKLGNPQPIRRIFLDQFVEGLFKDITRQAQIFSMLAGIAVFVACLGLFGLSAFTAERRTKEIGIRKAMGASRWDIVKLLVWQFIKPVLWANLIAWPVGYYFMNRWLHGFAYHVDLEPWIFLVAAALAFVIALATVSAHAFLVARARPTTALRYE